MGHLNYQIIGRRSEVVASGTITTSGAMSAPISLPTSVKSGSAIRFAVVGAPVYVHMRQAGADEPSGTGAHAASDAQPRTLVRDGSPETISLDPYEGGQFAAVNAAAFT